MLLDLFASTCLNKFFSIALAKLSILGSGVLSVFVDDNAPSS